MTGSPAKLRTSIRITVVAAFVFVTALTAAVAIGLQYYFGHSMARQTASELYDAAAAGIAKELGNIANINNNVISLLASNPELARTDNAQGKLETFTAVMEKNPLYYGIYLGHEDGGFFEVINLNNGNEARKAFHALPSDRWLVTTVEPAGNGYQRSFHYLDSNLKTRISRSEATDFDVTTRPWYQSAMTTQGINSSEPYLFAQLGVPGQTLSHRINGTATVIGIDMTMSTISALLRENAIADSSDIFLYSSNGEVLASSREAPSTDSMPPVPALDLTEQERAFIRALPILKVSNELDWPPFDFAQGGQPRGYSVDVVKMLAAMTGIQVRFVNGYSWPELKEQFHRGEIDLLQSALPSPDNMALGMLGQGYATLPYAIATKSADAATKDLGQLAGRSLAIPTGWPAIPVIQEMFPAINIVETATTLESLERVQAGEVDAALDSEIIMRYLAQHYFLGDFQYTGELRIGDRGLPDSLHVLVPDDKPKLREILDKAISALGTEQRDHLARTWLEFESTDAIDTLTTVPDEAMVTIAADTAMQKRIVESRQAGENWLLYVAPSIDAAAKSRTIYVGIRARLGEVVSPFLQEVKVSIGITSALLLLLLPLAWLFSTPIVHPIRQLAIQNDKVRRREYGKVTRVSSGVLELDELSESMVDMVESIRAHELAQRRLMDSFIELIAEAIDDKSAYTGSHCERVPELAMMLAKSASESKIPAFADFQLTTDDQWREYRISAWLHDCGKITTPEHIVDKGSKLETIYNRLHEVRMRFEVLWRDAEIAYLKTSGGSALVNREAELTLQETRQQLLEDFDFVAHCNVGGEFLAEQDQERLREIAKTTWQRHFDDRIGLSPTEELRLSPDRPDLPVTEPLLSDKAEHLIHRTRPTNYPPEFGIDMDIPHYLGNLGEVYNLSVSRGTLTTEDRFRINEHMISTIKMLESLPFPEELSNVPRYASTHHETMRGSGYPRKLAGEELSIPERILAVADIFEALTASDRPYKKAKTISEALDILHKMVDDNHVDRSCFELFVSEGVYMEYATRFLDPAQINDVDIHKYLHNLKQSA